MALWGVIAREQIKQELREQRECLRMSSLLLILLRMSMTESKKIPRDRFAASQLWQPTANHDPFPTSFVLLKDRNALRGLWSTMKRDADLVSRVGRLHCVRTNEVGDTVKFSPSVCLYTVTPSIVQLYFL